MLEDLCPKECVAPSSEGRQHLSSLPGLFPAAKLPKTKPQSPAEAFELQGKTCLEYPSSMFYRPLMPSKDHTSPSDHFVLEFSSGIPAFPAGEAWFVGTNTAFVKPVYLAKTRATFERTAP